jgi:Tol biopolymer transport system component
MVGASASGAVVFNPGTLEEHVIGNGGRFPWPCLAPNGTKVVAGSDGGVDQGLYIMNLDGSNLRQLTTSLDHQPTWSNDVLVFVRIGAGGSLTNGDLYLMRGINE